MRKEKNKKQVLNFLVLRLAEGLWRKTTILMKARLPPATPQVITTHISGRTGSFSSTDYFVRRPKWRLDHWAQNPTGYPGRVLGLKLILASFDIYFCLATTKRDPLMADIRSGVRPCMPISPWGTCWKHFWLSLWAEKSYCKV